MSSRVFMAADSRGVIAAGNRAHTGVTPNGCLKFSDMVYHSNARQFNGAFPNYSHINQPQWSLMLADGNLVQNNEPSMTFVSGQDLLRDPPEVNSAIGPSYRSVRLQGSVCYTNTGANDFLRIIIFCAKTTVQVIPNSSIPAIDNSICPVGVPTAAGGVNGIFSFPDITTGAVQHMQPTLSTINFPVDVYDVLFDRRVCIGQQHDGGTVMALDFDIDTDFDVHVGHINAGVLNNLTFPLSNQVYMLVYSTQTCTLNVWARHTYIDPKSKMSSLLSFVPDILGSSYLYSSIKDSDYEPKRRLYKNRPKRLRRD